MKNKVGFCVSSGVVHKKNEFMIRIVFFEWHEFEESFELVQDVLVAKIKITANVDRARRTIHFKENIILSVQFRILLDRPRVFFFS
jgi:hypothetical protein